MKARKPNPADVLAEAQLKAAFFLTAWKSARDHADAMEYSAKNWRLLAGWCLGALVGAGVVLVTILAAMSR